MPPLLRRASHAAGQAYTCPTSGPYSPANGRGRYGICVSRALLVLCFLSGLFTRREAAGIRIMDIFRRGCLHIREYLVYIASSCDEFVVQGSCRPTIASILARYLPFCYTYPDAALPPWLHAAPSMPVLVALLLCGYRCRFTRPDLVLVCNLVIREVSLPVRLRGTAPPA
jgi:hypothetical protein